VSGEPCTADAECCSGTCDVGDAGDAGFGTCE
jgi:hypothetical protein